MKVNEIRSYLKGNNHDSIINQRGTIITLEFLGTSLVRHIILPNAFSLFSKSKLKQKRAAASQGTNRKGHEKDVKEKKHEKSSDRLTVTREATAPKDKQSERANTSGNLSDRSESTEDPDKYVI